MDDIDPATAAHLDAQEARRSERRLADCEREPDPDWTRGMCAVEAAVWRGVYLLAWDALVAEEMPEGWEPGQEIDQ